MLEKILMIIGTWMEKEKISDVWMNERPLDGYTWSGGRLKETNNFNVWPDMWKHMSDEAKKQSEAKVGHRETQTR